MRKFDLAALVMLSLLPAMSAQRSAAEPVSALYTASLHTFSVLRSGVSINDPVTGVQHAASHTQDATLAGTSDHRDLTGGWYNAGDYGKWSNTTAIAVSYMLHLYGVQERAAGSYRSRHPPDPELLEQARWGLAWMDRTFDPLLFLFFFLTIFLPSGSVYGFNLKYPTYACLLPLAGYTLFRRGQATVSHLVLLLVVPFLISFWILVGLTHNFGVPLGLPGLLYQVKN